MAGEYGIQETKEVVGFIVELGNGIGKAREDGDWSASDLVYFMDALLAVPAAFQGIDKVPMEVKDLDEAEMKELSDYVVEEFDIPQDKIEEVIEDAIHIAWKVWELVKKIRNL